MLENTAFCVFSRVYDHDNVVCVRKWIGPDYQKEECLAEIDYGKRSNLKCANDPD